MGQNLKHLRIYPFTIVLRVPYAPHWPPKANKTLGVELCCAFFCSTLDAAYTTHTKRIT